jgi:acyl-CoA thioester hydrolase
MSFPVSLSIAVAWGEMDAFGHVNNTVFFRYFESTRIAYMQRIDGMGAENHDFSPVVASARCDFLAPVVFPDTVVGETRVSRLGTSSFTMEYQLTSQSQNKIVARGEAVMVNVDRSSGRSQPIPALLRSRIEELEGRV